MSFIAALALAGTGTLAAAPPSIAGIPAAPQFKDWIAACNNVRVCELSAARGSSGGDMDWTLHVTRGAAAADAPVVSAAPGFNVYDQPARIRIDGALSPFTLDISGYLAGDAISFLQAIARARTAHVVGSNGEVIGRLPVMGAAASLRWIDDQQKRAGTRTAIIARGARPASDVPPPPPAPRIAQPDPSDKPAKRLEGAALEAVRKLGDCRRAAGKDEFYRLDARRSLGLIACNLGAYQGHAIAVTITDAGDWSLAKIEQPREWPAEYGPADPWIFSSVTTADFAPATRILSEFAKARGLADCGQSARWAWDGDMFRLASFNEMRECRGTPPGNWPSLWVTANVTEATAR